MEHRTEMYDSNSRGRFEPLQSQFMDCVSGKSSALLKHFNPNPFISRTPNSWQFLQQGQRFPLLSYISPLPDICQFYVRGLEMPVIVLQHENDVNFPTGPFLCDVEGKAADNPAKMPTHHIIYKTTSLLLGSVSCTLESYKGGWGVGGWCHLSSRALNLRVNTLVCWALEDDDDGGGGLERWWWWWCWSAWWSWWWWWQWWCNLP